MFAIGENSVGTSDHLLSDHLGDEATLYMLQTMVRALLHSKPQINSLTWSILVRQIVKYQTPSVVDQIFQTIITEGRADVIKLFCESGVNPFKAIEGQSPAIFGLVYRPDVCFKSIFSAIFKGMEEYYLKHLAGLYKSKRNLTIHPQKVWQDEQAELEVAKDSQSTLIQEAICQGNEDFAQYLILHSDSEVVTKFAWTPLHEAVMLNSESVIKSLVRQGFDINLTGCRGFSSDFEKRWIWQTYFDKCDTSAWYFNVSPLQLSKLRSPSNTDFLMEAVKQDDYDDYDYVSETQKTVTDSVEYDGDDKDSVSDVSIKKECVEKEPLNLGTYDNSA